MKYLYKYKRFIPKSGCLVKYTLNIHFNSFISVWGPGLNSSLNPDDGRANQRCGGQNRNRRHQTFTKTNTGLTASEVCVLV